MHDTRVNARDHAPAAAANGTAEPAFHALLTTFGLLKRVMEPYFARFGVSGAQWGVLRTLQCLEAGGQGEPRLTDLGNHLLVRPPSMTGAIDRLQRMGLVRRSASSTDHRAKHVSLTPAGRSLVSRVLEQHREQIETVLGGLQAAEQVQLKALLSHLNGHLHTMAARTERGVASAPAARAVGDAAPGAGESGLGCGGNGDGTDPEGDHDHVGGNGIPL